ncbi:AAA family ATPase [Nocardia otitidiscaviarum]|uniref:AAA family ATPase n=1 Tax=Nocardia otitidiscaviarum TaxID=1823 RepID=A0A516NSD3_9NOCA|nr:crosslink repair DNA glycosylase YcaQ family protein [Nocardia otitidiscaviarum]MCP9621056.1 putative DNA binding domain-containing protein [Nocardia otitidiscaviarum]QDP81817.1 AAA family ATPase [Nocardia otitidiscaviarum]
MEPDRLRDLIARGETLTTEFKRGAAGKFNDTDLVETCVCMANGDGGFLLIGVEDDGSISGAAPRHGTVTDPSRIDALIASRTVPLLQTYTETVELDGYEVIVIDIPKSPRVVGTSNGVYVRRALRIDGTPQCLPFPAYDMLAHEIDRGAVDFAAIPARGATMDELDPAEFDRFRMLARTSGADTVLTELSDTEICRALGVLRCGDDGTERPTLGAVLLFGRESAIALHIPNHEAAFQLFDGLSLETNHFTRAPLLRAAEDLYARVQTWNREEEVQLGLLRVALPRVPHTVVREAIANALVHRDYTALGATRVTISDDAFEVSSPGAFPPGVRLDNLLSVSQPRSPILADAFRRAGIVERSGRGISLMYSALLRLGRDTPDYSQSTDRSVRAIVPLGSADIALARFIADRESRDGRPMRLFDLQVLHELRLQTNLSASEIAEQLHRTPGETRAGLTRMIEDGLVELRGGGRGRMYHLSAAVYRALDNPPAYIRVRGADSIQQEGMVLQYVESFGAITRAQAAELCMITPSQAGNLLRRMSRAGKLVLQGQRKAARYILPSIDPGGRPQQGR